MTDTGRVEAVPDRATASAGVTGTGKTASEALRNNSAAMIRVINVLREAGVEARDIATSGLASQPVYDRGKQSSSIHSQGPQIIGYRVSNQVTVLFRDLETMGARLNALVRSGENRLNGVSFIASDADKRLDSARADAMKDAIRKAEIYAQAAGVKSGSLKTTREGGGGFRPPVPLARGMVMGSAAMDVPVEASGQTLGVTVSVIFQAKD